MAKFFSITAMGILSMVLAGHAGGDNMKAFPPPEEGMVRYVLELPKQEDESTFKVELIAGRTVQVDERNRYFFGGEIRSETNIVSRLGPMAGTKIAVDPTAPKVDRFVTLGGEPFLIRYNSRLPVVVYAPEGVEVRYRIWAAEPEMKRIEKR